MWAGPPAANIVNTTAGLIVAALVIAALSLGRDFLIPFTLAGLFSQLSSSAPNPIRELVVLHVEASDVFIEGHLRMKFPDCNRIAKTMSFRRNE